MKRRRPARVHSRTTAMVHHDNVGTGEGGDASPSDDSKTGNDAHAEVSARPDVLAALATPATPVAKPSGQRANISSAASLTTLGGRRSGPAGVSLRREVSRRVEGKLRSLERRRSGSGLSPAAAFVGFVAGQASQSSSATTYRKKVVLHSARRDAPTVCCRRVIMLRRKSPAR
jgi:hypothetical protein